MHVLQALRRQKKQKIHMCVRALNIEIVRKKGSCIYAKQLTTEIEKKESRLTKIALIHSLIYMNQDSGEQLQDLIDY